MKKISLVDAVRDNGKKVAAAALGAGLAVSASLGMGSPIDDLVQSGSPTSMDIDDSANPDSNTDDFRTESAELADQLEVNNSGEVERQLYSC